MLKRLIARNHRLVSHRMEDEQAAASIVNARQT